MERMTHLLGRLAGGAEMRCRVCVVEVDLDLAFIHQMFQILLFG